MNETLASNFTRQLLPKRGTSDWVKTFEDHEYQEALKYAVRCKDGDVFTYVIDMWPWVEYNQPTRSK